MNTSYKSTFLTLFKTSIFPQNLIQKECLKHRDFLFSEFPIKPDMILKQNKNFSISDCFIPKKLEEPVDDLSVKKTLSIDTINSKYENPKVINSKTPKAGTSGWKRGEDKLKDNTNSTNNTGTLRSLNFVDNTSKTPTNNFNAKFNENLNIFQKSTSQIEAEEINNRGSLNNLNLNESDKDKTNDSNNVNNEINQYENNNNDYQNNFNMDPHNFNPNNRPMIFNNINLTNSGHLNHNANIYPITGIPNTQMPHNMQNMQFNSQPQFINYNMPVMTPVKTEYITKVCDFLKLTPDVDPLWYIFHPISHSSFGPVTTQQLIDTCNVGMANSQTDVRLLDTFSIKGFKPFSFIKLQIVERDDFVDFIEDSVYLQNSCMYKQYQNLEKINEVNEFYKHDLLKNVEENHKLKEKLASLELELNLLKELNKYSQKKTNDDVLKKLNSENIDDSHLQISSVFSNKNSIDKVYNVVVKQFLDPDNEYEEDTHTHQKKNNNNFSKSENYNANNDTDFKQVKKKRPNANNNYNANTNNNEQYYTVSTATKKVVEKDHKTSNKVDLIGGEELVNLLNPSSKTSHQSHQNQHKEPKEEQDYEKEKEKVQTNQTNYTSNSVKSKKGKGKPVDLDVKLGFSHDGGKNDETFKVVSKGNKKK